MMGAPTLVSRGAMRAGAGYVRLGVPGAPPGRCSRRRGGGPGPAARWTGTTSCSRRRPAVPGAGHRSGPRPGVRRRRRRCSGVAGAAAGPGGRRRRRAQRPGDRRGAAPASPRPATADRHHPARRRVRPAVRRAPRRRPAGRRPPGGRADRVRSSCSKGLDDHGRGARRPGPAGGRRVAPPGDGGDGRRAVRGHRRLRRPRGRRPSRRAGLAAHVHGRAAGARAGRGSGRRRPARPGRPMAVGDAGPVDRGLGEPAAGTVDTRRGPVRTPTPASCAAPPGLGGDRPAAPSATTPACSPTLVPPARLCAVVKAWAYGHGPVRVARAALEGGATWLAVALVEEGRQLRAAGIDRPGPPAVGADRPGHGRGRPLRR